MFNKQNDNDILKDVEAVVGPNTHVKGKFNCTGNIVVEGELNGSIKSGGFLLVGAQAKITATIEANEAKIGGIIDGGIKIKNVLHITGSAIILGDIECGALIIEEGAQFNGKCGMTSGSKETKGIKKSTEKQKKSSVGEEKEKKK